MIGTLFGIVLFPVIALVICLVLAVLGIFNKL